MGLTWIPQKCFPRKKKTEGNQNKKINLTAYRRLLEYNSLLDHLLDCNSLLDYISFTLITQKHLPEVRKPRETITKRKPIGLQ